MMGSHQSGRHRVPRAERTAARTSNRYLAAWAATAGLNKGLRVARVLAALPSEVARPMEADSPEPPERLHLCPMINDCLEAAAAAQWPQMSCARCPVYKERSADNATWLRGLIATAATSKKER